MKKRIRLWDATRNTQQTMWSFLDCLKDVFEFEETSIDPDYVFSSNTDRFILNYSGVRIWLTGENLIPDFNVVDYAIGFSDIRFDDRYLRWPLYRWGESLEAIETQKRAALVSDPPEGRKAFCACIVSNLTNRQGPLVEMCDLLSMYSSVTYGGKWRNNIGGRVEDKMGLLRQHRFSLAFENTSYPGYTTEKIVDAFKAGTIPIYWGDPTIVRCFNPRAFVLIKDSDSLDMICGKVKQINEDEGVYRSMLMEPIFTDLEREDFDQEKAVSFLKHIFSQPKEEAYRRNRSRWGLKYEAIMRRCYFNPLGQLFRLPKIWCGVLGKNDSCGGSGNPMNSCAAEERD